MVLQKLQNATSGAPSSCPIRALLAFRLSRLSCFVFAGALSWKTSLLVIEKNKPRPAAGGKSLGLNCFFFGLSVNMLRKLQCRCGNRNIDRRLPHLLEPSSVCPTSFATARCFRFFFSAPRVQPKQSVPLQVLHWTISVGPQCCSHRVALRLCISS